MPPQPCSASDLAAWLEQTVEPALQPQLPIVDGHFHFWDRTDASLLFGHDETAARWWQGEHDEGGLLERYLAAELQADIARSGHRVLATVFVDCGFNYRPAGDGPAAFRSVGETESVEQLLQQGPPAQAAAGLAAGVISSLAPCDFDDPALPAVLAAHAAASPRFRGVRGSVPAGLGDQHTAWLDGFAVLAGRELVFECNGPELSGPGRHADGLDHDELMQEQHALLRHCCAPR